MALKENEKGAQKLTQEELKIRVSNIEYAYIFGLVKMNDVIRLIKAVYRLNDVSKNPDTTG